MLLNELLLEAFPAELRGDRFLDLRDPDAQPIIGKRHRVHISLTADGRAIIFNYADANRIPWNDVLVEVKKNPAPFQPGYFGIVAYRNGFMIDETRDSSPTWAPILNRYSTDLKEIVQGLIAVGLAHKSTPFWTGCWAREKADRSIGSASRILAQRDDPTRLTLYHGTSNWRWEMIKENGLSPIDVAGRMWKNERQSTPHRDTSVYLTASMRQAKYYAQKAVRVDVKTINRTTGMAAYRALNTTQDEVVRRLAAWFHEGRKLEPVILQVMVPKSEYVNLRADDDFLRGSPEYSLMDWEKSLSFFGQVAYEGSIPPSRIKFYSTV